jgi:putative oxidoreductase
MGDGLNSPLPDWAAAGWAQAFAAIAEFGGGIALAAGLLTPLAALAVAATMAMAVYFHVAQGDPLVSSGGRSYELALTYLAAALCILLCGPGKASADAMLFKRN